MTTPATAGHEAHPLLTVTQAAERLATSRWYIYNRIKDGTLPTVQLGTGTQSKTRIRATDLHAFINARTTGAGTGR